MVASCPQEEPQSGRRGRDQLGLSVNGRFVPQGIARRLVADLVQTARAGGVGTLLVSGNPPAKAFYLSVGFVEFGTVVTELGSTPRLRMDLTSSHSSTPP